MEKSKLILLGSEGVKVRNFSELVVFGPDGLYDGLRIPGLTMVLAEGDRNRKLWVGLPRGRRKLFAGNERLGDIVIGQASIIVLIGLLSLFI